MEVKAQKTKGGLELLGSLPDEMANAASLEIFPLRDGLYLVSAKGAIDRARGAIGAALELTEQERQLVKKLLAIKFEKRTPADVDRTLSSQEKATLSALMQRKVVNVFRSGKYESGVYNVSDAIFGHSRDAAGAPQNATAGKATAAPAAPQRASDPLAKGWLVLDNEGDARMLSGALSDRIKSGDVSGLRAFDRKYYYTRKDFADRWQPKLLKALEKGDKTAEELSREVGLDAEGCRALLLHMGEGGELLEKSKGKFALA